MLRGSGAQRQVRARLLLRSRAYSSCRCAACNEEKRTRGSFTCFGVRTCKRARVFSTGFHVRCKTTGSRLYAGASQDLRIALALAINERFGWTPVIQRSAASIELLVTFHNTGSWTSLFSSCNEVMRFRTPRVAGTRARAREREAVERACACAPCVQGEDDARIANRQRTNTRDPHRCQLPHSS